MRPRHGQSKMSPKRKAAKPSMPVTARQTPAVAQGGASGTDGHSIARVGGAPRFKKSTVRRRGSEQASFLDTVASNYGVRTRCKHCYLFNSDLAAQEIAGAFHRREQTFAIADDYVESCMRLDVIPRVSLTGGNPCVIFISGSS